LKTREGFLVIKQEKEPDIDYFQWKGEERKEVERMRRRRKKVESWGTINFLIRKISGKKISEAGRNTPPTIPG
jgi:hypothetical protein